MGKIIGKIFAPAAPAQTQTLRCEICGKEYKTEKGLAEHMKKDHPLDIMPGGDPPGEDPSGEGGT